MGPEEAKQLADNIVDNVATVIIGKRHVIQHALISAVCGGHILIDDVPGVGKTVLAKSLSISFGCTFKRVQFTPDLLPSDVLGVSIYDQESREFTFRPGPVMSQVLLADEVNRGTPKTQSALLEAMEENQITVDGVTHFLPKPFIVLATQNPLEHEGTFPLPEAQRDRFFMRVHLGYPTKDDEKEIMEQQQEAHPIESLQSVITPDQLNALQETVRGIYVDDLVKQYIVDIADATRNREDVYVGVSPRGSLALFRGSQARALLDGRDYVSPDDVKGLVQPVLQHRIILSSMTRLQETTAESVLDHVLDSIPVPGTSSRGWFRAES
ncbi:MoxR family ATPase [Dehalococcoidia bacterium]|nr:MoxR family ATPase [Dehalococcoidia bacterium]